MEDATLDIADYAAPRHEEQPNSRHQFDNTVSLTQVGRGGDHLFKGGVQFGRLYFDDSYDVLNDSTCFTTAAEPTAGARVQHADRRDEPRQHARAFSCRTPGPSAAA